MYLFTFTLHFMPMEQFEILPLIAPIIILFIFNSIHSRNIIPSNIAILFESLYRTILLIIISNLGYNKLKLFPLLFSLFFIIFLSNILGLIPYTATPSVELILTLSLALTLLLGILISAIISEHKLYITHLFLPGGTPLFLIPLMIILEILAYITRTLSLGLRLGVNIITGHILVKVCISFATNLSSILFLLPLVFTTLFLTLEILIAYLQAYIFLFIFSITLKDLFSY